MKPGVINVLSVDSLNVAAWMNYYALKSYVERVYPNTNANGYWVTSGNEAVAMVSDGIIDFDVILMSSDSSLIEGCEVRLILETFTYSMICWLSIFPFSRLHLFSWQAIKNLRKPPIKFEEAIVGVGWADTLAVADFIQAGANKVFQRPLTDDNLAAVMPFISKLKENWSSRLSWKARWEGEIRERERVVWTWREESRET